MNVPVLVMTADSSVASESRCLQLGALDFLVKPYNGTIILQRAGILSASGKIRPCAIPWNVIP
jgi:DNA-binding response OmpR family regulator